MPHIVDEFGNEVQLESFAAFMLAAQLASALLSGGVTNAVTALRGSGMNNLPATDQIVEVEKAPTGAHAGVEGWHFTGDKHIYINKNSATYRAAQAGDQAAIIKLASIIAHEQAHVMGGDETAAYTKQIEALHAMAHGRTDIANIINGVQRSAQSVGVTVR